MSAPNEVRAWLDQFAAAVRSRDLDAGRAMFASDCTSFGTRMTQADSIDELAQNQWGPIWTITTGFAFEPEPALAWSDDGSQVVVMVQWTSFTDADVPALRRGRATIVLDQAPHRPLGLVATHTHFSESPVS